MPFESGHDPADFGYLEFELHASICGLWLPHGAAKNAGAPFVRFARVVIACVRFRPLGVLHF